MSQHNFMRNLRMTMPQHVTNVTSFGDAVRILKNKGILTEVYEGDGTIKYVESQLNYMVDGDSITFNEFKAAMSYLKDHSEEIVKEFGDNVSLEDATKIAKTIVDTATNESLTEEWDSPYDGGQDDLDAMSRDAKPKIKVPIIVKAERHPLPALKNRIILTLSNGEKVSVPDNELEGIYGGDINDLDYYVGQEWDQEPYVDTNTGEVRESKVKTLKEAKEVMPSGKETYAKFEKEVPANLQEIITGIKIEHDCNPDKSYKDIVKLVVKNLKKQPNYYTNWKLSGIEGEEPKIEGSVKSEDREMKFAKDDNTVDKAMGMKPVKGVEKAKASANKAKKETTKAEKVDLMSLIAQTVRGLQKMNATGEKMKKVVVK